MNNYRTGDIRNIAVLGGSGSGKTTLVEAAAFAGENKNYLGSIAQAIRSVITIARNAAVDFQFIYRLFRWNGTVIRLIS